jgi:hypothetical protein
MSSQQFIDAVTHSVSPLLQEKSCPICSNSSWVIFDSPFELRQMREIRPMPQVSKTVPLVVVACHVCGYTLLFNAVNRGAITEPVVRVWDAK